MRKRENKSEGWKAPATFAEYVAANPNGNVRWLRSHYSPKAPDFDDIAQDILVEIAETRVVERYSPNVADSPSLFFNWVAVNYDFALKKILSRRKTHKRSVNHKTESIDHMVNNHGEAMSPDDIMLSDNHQHLCEQEGERVFTTARISQFRAFVKEHRPDIIPALDRFLNGHENRKVYRVLMPKLQVLAKHFENGTTPAKSHKVKRSKQQRQRKYRAKHRDQINARRRQRRAEKRSVD